MLTNPVPGVILAKGSPGRAPGQFIVTRTAADHVATGSGPALDIGNGREGSDVYAAADGKVLIFVDATNGALIVRVDHGNLIRGLKTVTGYAHVQSPFVVRQDQVVKRGQKIATVGSTGAPRQPHLHFGVTVAGVSVDPWPLLEQNTLPDTGTGDDDMKLKGTPLPLPGSAQRMTTVTKDGLVIVADPTAMPYTQLGSLPAGKSVTVDWQVKGNLILGSDLWYGFWSWTTPPQFGYISAGGCEPLTSMTGNYEEGYNDGLAAAEAAVEEVPEK